MKKLCLIPLLITVASAWAQDLPRATLSQTNKAVPVPEITKTNSVPQQEQKSPTQMEVNAREMPLQVKGRAPNEIDHGRMQMDGSLVQLAKTDHPLQLINPAAPVQYGSAEENLARDPVSGEASGVKLFELHFW